MSKSTDEMHDLLLGSFIELSQMMAADKELAEAMAVNSDRQSLLAETLFKTKNGAKYLQAILNFKETQTFIESRTQEILEQCSCFDGTGLAEVGAIIDYPANAEDVYMRAREEALFNQTLDQERSMSELGNQGELLYNAHVDPNKDGRAAGRKLGTSISRYVETQRKEQVQIALLKKINGYLADIRENPQGTPSQNIARLNKAYQAFIKDNALFKVINEIILYDDALIESLSYKSPEFKAELKKLASVKQFIDAQINVLDKEPYNEACELLKKLVETESVGLKSDEIKGVLKELKEIVDHPIEPLLVKPIYNVYQLAVTQRNILIREAYIEKNPDKMERAKKLDLIINEILSSFQDKFVKERLNINEHLNTDPEQAITAAYVKLLSDTKYNHHESEDSADATVMSVIINLSNTPEIENPIKDIASRASAYYDFLVNEFYAPSSERIEPHEIVQDSRAETKLSENPGEIFSSRGNRLKHINAEKYEADNYLSEAVSGLTSLVVDGLSTKAKKDSSVESMDDTEFHESVQFGIQTSLNRKFGDALAKEGITRISEIRKKLQSHDKTVTADEIVRFANLFIYIKHDVEGKLSEIDKQIFHKSEADTVEMGRIASDQEIDKMKISDERKALTKEMNAAFNYIENKTTSLYVEMQKEVSQLLSKFIRDDKSVENKIESLVKEIKLIQKSPVLSEGSRGLSGTLIQTLGELTNQRDVYIEMASQDKVPWLEVVSLTGSACRMQKIAAQISPLVRGNVQAPETEMIKIKLLNELRSVLSSDQIDEARFKKIIDVSTQLYSSGMLDIVQYSALNQKISDEIISQGKVIQSMRIINKYDLNDNFGSLNKYSSDVIGTSVIVKIGENDTQVAIQSKIASAIRGGAKTNIVLSLPENLTTKGIALAEVTGAIQRSPLLVVIVDEKFTPGAIKNKEEGFFSGMFAQYNESTIASQIQEIEKLSNKNMDVLVYMENQLASDSKLPVSKFCDGAIKLYSNLTSHRAALGEIYFERFFSRKNNLSADDIISFVRDTNTQLGDDEILNRLSSLKDIPSENIHRVFLIMAKHHLGLQNPGVALKYLDFVPRESALYAQAIRTMLEVQNVMLKESFDTEESSKLLGSLEQSVGLLLLRMDGDFGPTDVNLSVMSSCINGLLANTALDQNLAARSITRILDTILTSSLHPSANKEVIKILIEGFLANNEYKPFHAALIDKLYTDTSLNARSWLTTTQIMDYAKSLIENRNIPSSSDGKLNEQIILLSQMPVNDPGVWESVYGRYNALTSAGKSKNDTLMTLMKFMLKFDALDEDKFKALTDIMSNFKTSDLNFDSEQALFSDLIATSIDLAVKNPEHGADILVKMIRALPLKTQQEMANNDDRLYVTMKPLRDAVNKTPNDDSKAMLLGSYPVLRKKDNAERLAMKARRAGGDVASALELDKAAQFAGSVLKKADSFVNRVVAGGTRDRSDSGSSKKSQDSEKIDEFVIVENERAGSDRSTSSSPALSASTQKFIQEYDSAFTARMKQIEENGNKPKNDVRAKMVAAHEEIEACKLMRQALTEYSGAADQPSSSSSRPVFTKKKYLGVSYSGPQSNDDITKISQTAEALQAKVQLLETRACKAQCEAIQEYYAGKLAHWGVQYQDALRNENSNGVKKAETHFGDNKVRAKNTLDLFNQLKDLASTPDKDSQIYKSKEQLFRRSFMEWKEADLNKSSGSTKSTYDMFRKGATFALDKVAKNLPMKQLESDHAYYQQTLSCENLINLTRSPEGIQAIQATCQKLEDFTKADIQNTKSISEFLSQVTSTITNAVKNIF